jgi:hypothetical protein
MMLLGAAFRTLSFTVWSKELRYLEPLPLLFLLLIRWFGLERKESRHTLIALSSGQYKHHKDFACKIS